MDCREFRKLHFAYLDDTLPGDTMSVAQRHVMACDSCAAHDSMVRRSLMLVRNMSVIEPSAAFRQKMQARLDATRAETQRDRPLTDRPLTDRPLTDRPLTLMSDVNGDFDAKRNRSLRLVSDAPPVVQHDASPGFKVDREVKSSSRGGVKPPMVLSAVAASVLMMGVILWRQSATTPSASTAGPATAAIVQPAIDTTLQPIHLTPEMVQAMSTGNPMWPAALMVDDAPAQLVNSEFTTVKSLRD